MNRIPRLFTSLFAALILNLAAPAHADDLPDVQPDAHADASTATTASTAPDAQTDQTAQSNPDPQQDATLSGTDHATAQTQPDGQRSNGDDAPSWTSWASSAWATSKQHLDDVWTHGDWEVYVPFWTYHLPFAYSPEKRRSYTEYPRGGGFGKGWYNASGNWEGIYAMEYQDSHGMPQYQFGYGWIPTWRPLPFDSRFKVGVGATAFIFFRSDIGHYAPIPGLLPVLSVGYGPVDVQMAYVPGGKGNGNVLFWWAKFAFR